MVCLVYGDVDTTPRLIVDQAPAMSSANKISPGSTISLAPVRLELEPPAQGDHILAMRGIVPVEAGSRGGLFKEDGLGLFSLREGVEGFRLFPFDLAHREMRLVVISGEEANEPERHARLTLLRFIEPLTA
jgi:hypothetical protein